MHRDIKSCALTLARTRDTARMGHLKCKQLVAELRGQSGVANASLIRNHSQSFEHSRNDFYSEQVYSFGHRHRIS